MEGAKVACLKAHSLLQWGTDWWESGGFAVSGKEPACNAGAVRDVGSIPALGRSSGGGHGNPFQYSCLENSMDRGAWRAIVHAVAELDMTEHLSMQRGGGGYGRSVASSHPPHALDCSFQF